jgi:hypothetical protein
LISACKVDVTIRLPRNSIITARQAFNDSASERAPEQGADGAKPGDGGDPPDPPLASFERLNAAPFVSCLLLKARRKLHTNLVPLHRTGIDPFKGLPHRSIGALFGRMRQPLAWCGASWMRISRQYRREVDLPGLRAAIADAVVEASIFDVRRLKNLGFSRR